MKAEQAWQAALGQLQLEMPRPVFDTWVSEAELVAHEDGEFIIGVPNAYARDWLDNRLSSTVTRLLTGIMNRAACVRFIVWQNGYAEDAKQTPDVIDPYHEESNPANNSTLNTRYSFDNFVVGAGSPMPPLWQWRKILQRHTTHCFYTAVLVSGRLTFSTPSGMYVTSAASRSCTYLQKNLPTT
jgi:hypothetical protein